MRQDLTMSFTKNMHFTYHDTDKWEGKNGKKIYNAITKHKQLSMTILISAAVDFKTNSIIRD